MFGGNAFISIIILSLITIFLFKEGVGFFGQYRDSLALHRESGLEYVELMRQEQDALSALNRYLNSIRSLQSEKLSEQGLEFAEVKKELARYDDFFFRFEDLALPLRDLVLDANEIIADARDRYLEIHNLVEHRKNLEKQGMLSELASIVVEEVDLRLVFRDSPIARVGISGNQSISGFSIEGAFAASAI